MKKIKVLSLFLTTTAPLFLLAQLQVKVINVAANDLVYDKNTDRIYAALNSENGENGNSIGIINAGNNTIEKTIFIGSDPSVLAISDNGQYIYSGFKGSSTVRQFDIASQTAGIQFGLGSDQHLGPYYAEDIEVMPGSPSTIAVARRNNCCSPRHEGVAIFDNGVMRSNTTPDHTGSNKIEFINANSLIGYNNETTEFGIRRMSVNNNGVNVTSITNNVLNNFSLDFIYHDNRMYSTDGKAVDTNFAPFVIGQFNSVNGPVTFDSYYNRVCYASYDWSGNITFKRFNPDTFLLFDSLPITQANGNVKNLITCGNGCYAFNTSDNKIVIIKDPALSTQDFNTDKTLTISPNPFSEFFNINYDNKIKEIQIVDFTGKVVKTISNPDKTVYTNQLSSGNYLLKITDEKGKILTQKVTKK